VHARPPLRTIGFQAVTENELDRIRSAYEARDLAGGGPYRWDNPGYVVFMQALERGVLGGLLDAGVSLAGARVLDVGCGSGYLLHRFREYGAGECHGIDLMEGRIDTARQRYPTLEFRVGSATELPYADGAFGLVTQFTCLSSILDDDVRLAVAREMRRVASGGWILSFDMHGGSFVRPPFRMGPGSTSTVGLDRRELVRLFGQPALLRREALAFDLAGFAGRHAFIAAALAAVGPLRSHLLGLWRVQS
jgi:SAM-dependent methyltransferase